MRIGIIAENYFPTLGGIQEHIRHLRNYLLSAGVNVAIFTGMPNVETSEPNPADAERSVKRVGGAFRYKTGGTYTQATVGPTAAFRLRRLLREEPCDVLNIHGPCDFGLPMLAAMMRTSPKVLTLHSCFPHAFWRTAISPYYKWVFSRAKSVIAVSEAARDAMHRYASFNAEIVPNGVDCAYWKAGRPSHRYLTPNTRNILYMGRLEPRNGPDLIIDAFSKVADAIPEARLIMAGAGPKRAEYELRVPEHLRERVKFIGAVYDERPDLLASCDLMVIPARAVGFSILVLEAFAAGRPVVAGPCLGINRAGDHWSNVILSEALTPESLASTLVQALETDHSERIARGRTIAERYDWTRIGPQLLGVFERAAARGSVRAARSKAA
jgi:phosphatidylinositol alpha-mannosyltransferase